MVIRRTLGLVVCLLLFLALAGPVLAVCPVCTVAVGASLGVSRALGVDDTVSSVWIGGLIVSSGLWLSAWVGKKGWKIPRLSTLCVLAMMIMVIVPLYISKLIGVAGNTLWGVDKIVLGTIAGAGVFYIAVGLDKWLRITNDGKVYFYYQKVIIPVMFLLIISIMFFVVTQV